MNDYHEKFSTTGRLSVTSTTPDEADTAHLRNEVSITCTYIHQCYVEDCILYVHYSTSYLYLFRLPV